MRRTLLMILVVCLASACKKSAISPGLFGKWELRHQMGSILGFDSTYKASNGRILQFNSDSSYKQYKNGKLVTQGQFHIKCTNYPTPNSLSMVFGNDSGFENLFILNGNKLQIGADFDDGVEADYEKISD